MGEKWVQVTTPYNLFTGTSSTLNGLHADKQTWWHEWTDD